MAARRKKTARAKAERSTSEGTARRPLWSGQIRLSLVAVPVLVYSAIKSGARLAFHQVHGPSGKRIRYEKVAPGIGPVDKAEILKGYEISKGHYVLLEEEEIAAVKLEAKRTFELVQFVAHGEIDPIYFDQPYYVAPDGELAEDAYRVLRDALRETGKLGLGQIVMRGREYVCALEACGDGLLMETIRFADEVQAAAPVFASVADERSDRELVALARELIRRKSSPFDPAAFQDRYTEALRALVEAKAKHQRPLEIEEEEHESAEIIDLVAALKKSVGAPLKPASARRRRAPRRKRG